MPAQILYIVGVILILAAIGYAVQRFLSRRNLPLTLTNVGETSTRPMPIAKKDAIAAGVAVLAGVMLCVAGWMSKAPAKNVAATTKAPPTAPGRPGAPAATPAKQGATIRGKSVPFTWTIPEGLLAAPTKDSEFDYIFTSPEQCSIGVKEWAPPAPTANEMTEKFAGAFQQQADKAARSDTSITMGGLPWKVVKLGGIISDSDIICEYFSYSGPQGAICMAVWGPSGALGRNETALRHYLETIKLPTAGAGPIPPKPAK